jgi:hypothetical protein
MRVTAYQSNAQRMLETYRIIHQKNLQELQRLNQQKEQSGKLQQVRNQWARPNSVDIMA